MTEPIFNNIICWLEAMFILFALHFIGDYVLQSDFLAKTKGENWYHLVIHSVLYTFPFYVYFGFDSRTICLIVTHIITDALKARWKSIDYVADQMVHIAIITTLYITTLFRAICSLN